MKTEVLNNIHLLLEASSLEENALLERLEIFWNSHNLHNSGGSAVMVSIVINEDKESGLKKILIRPLRVTQASLGESHE